MKSVRTPAIVLAGLYLSLLAFLAVSSSQLPERVATHFDWQGRPNAWMSRSSHLLFMYLFGLVFLLLAPGLLFLVRFLPDRSINLPHRDYWLAPERRRATLAFLFRHSLWFACIGVCFVAGVHYLILRANAQSSAQLSTPLLVFFAGSFLVAVAVWVISMIHHFRRVPARQTLDESR